MKNLLLTSFVVLTLGFAGTAHGGDKKAGKKAKTAKTEVTGLLNWTGYGVGKSHAGTLKLKSGHVEMNGEKLVGGEFVIDMNSLDTPDSDKLKNHLMSADFFDIEKNPESKFKITQVEEVPAVVTGGPTHKLIGNLTIKGKTAPIDVLAVIAKDGKKWSATGDAEIMDRTAYDLTYRSKKFQALAALGDKMIEDNIKLTISVTSK